MKKIYIAFVSLFLALLISCGNVFEEEDKYQKLTIVNQTNLFIKYSVIEGTSSATTSNAFYAQMHDYIIDRAGITIKQQLLCPAGHVDDTGELQLDKQTFEVNKGSYNCTLFVCKSNSYTGNPDDYINKASFNFSGNTTVTIAADGSIY